MVWKLGSRPRALAALAFGTAALAPAAFAPQAEAQCGSYAYGSGYGDGLFDAYGYVADGDIVSLWTDFNELVWVPSDCGSSPPSAPTLAPPALPPPPQVLKVISAVSMLVVTSFAEVDVTTIKADLLTSISEATGGAEVTAVVVLRVVATYSFPDGLSCAHIIAVYANATGVAVKFVAASCEAGARRSLLAQEVDIVTTFSESETGAADALTTIDPIAAMSEELGVEPSEIAQTTAPVAVIEAEWFAAITETATADLDTSIISDTVSEAVEEVASDAGAFASTSEVVDTTPSPPPPFPNLAPSPSLPPAPPPSPLSPPVTGGYDEGIPPASNDGAGDNGEYGSDGAYGTPAAGGYGTPRPASSRPPSPPLRKPPPLAPALVTVTSAATFTLSLEELEDLDIDALAESLLAALSDQLGEGLLPEGSYRVVQTVVVAISSMYTIEGDTADFDLEDFRAVYAMQYGIYIEDVVAVVTSTTSSRRRLFVSFDLQVDAIFPAARKDHTLAVASAAGGAVEVNALAASAGLSGLTLRSAPSATVLVQTELIVTDADALDALDTEALETAVKVANEEAAGKAGLEVSTVVTTERAEELAPPPAGDVPPEGGEQDGVTPGGDSKDGLSDGALAGIVIGALAFVGGAVGGIFVIRRRGDKAGDAAGESDDFTAIADAEEGHLPKGTQVSSNPTAEGEEPPVVEGVSAPVMTPPRAAAVAAANTLAATMVKAGTGSTQKRVITPAPKSTRPTGASIESHTVSVIASFQAVSFELLKADETVGKQFWTDVVRTVALGADVPEHRVAVVELTPRPMTDGCGTDALIDVTFCDPRDSHSARCSCLRFLFNLDNDREAVFGLEDFEQVYCRPTIASVKKTSVDIGGLLKFQRAVNRMINVIRLATPIHTGAHPTPHLPGPQAARKPQAVPQLQAGGARCPPGSGARARARGMLSLDSGDEEDAVSSAPKAAPPSSGPAARASGAAAATDVRSPARACDFMFDSSSSDDDVARRPARSSPLQMPEGVFPASGETSARLAALRARGEAARGGGSMALRMPEPGSGQRSTPARVVDIDFDSSP